ncbi:hypothetical protein RSSM_06300 [Rhodopirellula sallentina SM41]|uniref:Uncharacterized protein n=1 Tax=Rhodopirellula sallentina SM41 TaxID=1263870 RepID=M5TSV6_9BACT|nr:hypothetical protein RSSM_06300 [Rhodopirellula sallentina SM41]
MGGSMLLYRQFVERDDYELFVVTDKPGFQSSHFPVINYEHSPLVRRVQKTRLSLFAHDYIHTVASRRVPQNILDEAEAFQPDVIMMGAESWIADLAIRLARKMSLPLVGHFMDWPTYGMLGHQIVKNYCSKRFTKRYQACDLAFGICPEMLEALGPHRNSEIFYPPGKQRDHKAQPHSPRNQNERFQLLFAGNLGQWYGTMLLALAKEMENEPLLRLRIAGKNHEWSQAETKRLTDQGTFCGFLKGDQYQRELDEADALLVIMGFSEDSKLIESTSFKSKMADYLITGKPIIVWGPEYCTAATTAIRHGFAEVVNQETPSEVLTKTKYLSSNPQVCIDQVANGQRFFDKYLDPGPVFDNVLRCIKQLLPSSRTATSEPESRNATSR